MKKTIIISIYTLLHLQSLAQTDVNKTIVLGDTFCLSIHKPLPFKAGSVIQTSCDSTYVINKGRYILYEKAVKVIKDGQYIQTCKVLIKNYEDRIAEQNIAFNKLYTDYIKLDSVSHNVISSTRSTLVEVNNTLGRAESDIASVDKKMDDIKKTINQQRKKSFIDKILYGAGGVAVGILVGLLIVN